MAVTYDSPALQQKFIDAGAITYPFISDIDATTVKALGILNTDYAPGDSAYGIPYPGVFVVNPEKKIVGKVFLKDFRTRVDAQGVLAYALQVLR